jgi:hypothetical protein
MKSRLEEIERYRRLLRLVADERACKVLMELIAEAEARLRAEGASGAASPRGSPSGTKAHSALLTR